MVGLSKDSKETEIIEKVDEKTAIRYRVAQETIDLEALKAEKASLEEVLNAPKPTDKELIELGKAYHPYYSDKLGIQARIDEIDALLKL